MEALSQIRERGYASFFNDYKGNVICIGINYDIKSKEYSCVIEKGIIT